MRTPSVRLHKWKECQVKLCRHTNEMSSKNFRTCTGFSSNTRFDCLHYNTAFMFWSNEERKNSDVPLVLLPLLLLVVERCNRRYANGCFSADMKYHIMIAEESRRERAADENVRKTHTHTHRQRAKRKTEKQTHYARQIRDIDNCYCCTFSFVIFSFLFFVDYSPPFAFFLSCILFSRQLYLMLCYAVNGHAGNPWCLSEAAKKTKKANEWSIFAFEEPGESEWGKKLENRKRREKRTKPEKLSSHVIGWESECVRVRGDVHSYVLGHSLRFARHFAGKNKQQQRRGRMLLRYEFEAICASSCLSLSAIVLLDVVCVCAPFFSCGCHILRPISRSPCVCVSHFCHDNFVVPSLLLLLFFFCSEKVTSFGLRLRRCLVFAVKWWWYAPHHANGINLVRHSLSSSNLKGHDSLIGLLLEIFSR